jgi:DNA polymerase-3 subunit epsilon
VGHNVGFDIGMLKRLCKLANAVPFEDLFSHRSLDTMSILRYLHLAGKVPESALSSTGGFDHFGIIVPPADRHTALGDARATAELLNRMLALIKS